MNAGGAIVRECKCGEMVYVEPCKCGDDGTEDRASLMDSIEQQSDLAREKTESEMRANFSSMMKSRRGH